MGGANSKEQNLFLALKNNSKDKVDSILSESKELINVFINNDKDQTPIIVASIFNSYECIKTLLKYNPDLTYKYKDKNCFFIAIEKDNIFVLKELLENNALIEDNKINNFEDMNMLDYSIICISYRCSLYLKKFKGMKLKDIDYYINKNCNYTENTKFNIPLYIKCLEEEKDRSNCPSFYLTNKQKIDLDNYAPNPEETWNQFFKRLVNFELYHPPMVRKNTLSKDQINSVYVKTQTKLIESEFNELCKLNLD